MKSRPDFEWGQISAKLGEVIPALRGLRLEQIATPLGGLSNSNYRLDLPEGSLARTQVTASPVPLVPSHCDLVPENCLDTGSRMLLIDWEYARMNDPAWDLAYLCVEGAFDTTREHLLLASYADAAVTYGRLQVFKLLTCTLNALWGELQKGPKGNQFDNSWRQERLADAMQSAEDPRWTMWLA